MPFNLNENQSQAAAHKDGPMLVLAGPGSGKTAVITHRAAHMVSRHGIPPQNILVVTYSKNAAEQMKRRFGQLLPSAPVAFGTFHAVFYKILRTHRRLGLENIVKDGERKELVKRLLKEQGYLLEEDGIKTVLNELSLVRNDLMDLRYFHSSAIADDTFAYVCGKYQEYKDEGGKIDFDDMLCLCYEMFVSEPDTLGYWQSRFPYIMIDEFQDINKVQYEAVRLLASPGNNLFVVGDDDQSVYRFRGARPEFLLNFPKDYSNTRSVVLDTNYRSTDEIIGYSNGIISGNSQRYGKDMRGTGRSGVKPVFIKPDDQNSEAAEIAKQIKTLIANGVQLEEIAVIYRVNIQSRAFADAFLHMNIPYRVRDEAPVIYEHWAAQDIFAYLRLSVDRPACFNADELRIINKPFRYISKAYLEYLKKSNKSIFATFARDDALNTAQKTHISDLLTCLFIAGLKKTPYDALKHILTEYEQHIRDHCQYRKLDAAGPLEIAQEVLEAAKQFGTVTEYLTNVEGVIAAAKESARDDASPRVTLTTMHGAKGLEYRHVFIAGAVEDLIPHERSKTAAELEEERRLLYVGVTRAKDALYISVPQTRYDKKAKPSRFLGGIK
jgi:DNA helicase-2/ATP-dependent DNA helicase PcrA